MQPYTIGGIGFFYSMARLILIRHGETDYNSQNRYCGFSDPPLNNKGIRQVEKLMAKLKNISIDKVYSSDLKRAYQTAEIIFKNKPIEKAKNFREMNFGIFEGLKYEQIVKRYPEIYRKWIDNPAAVGIPQGENIKDLSKRITEELFGIFSCHRGKTIAVVTHAGPIKIILCNMLKYGAKMFWKIEVKPASLNIVEFVKGKSKTCRLNNILYSDG